MYLSESRLSHAIRDSGRAPPQQPTLIDTCLVCGGNDSMVRARIIFLATIAHVDKAQVLWAQISQLSRETTGSFLICLAIVSRDHYTARPGGTKHVQLYYGIVDSAAAEMVMNVDDWYSRKRVGITSVRSLRDSTMSVYSACVLSNMNPCQHVQRELFYWLSYDGILKMGHIYY